MERSDAIVVGAGPAGSTAAYRLACEGEGVLLLYRAEAGVPERWFIQPPFEAEISHIAVRHGTTTRAILMTGYPVPNPRKFTDRARSSDEDSEAMAYPAALPWLAGEDFLNAIVWDEETLDKFHCYFPPKNPDGPAT